MNRFSWLCAALALTACGTDNKTDDGQPTKVDTGGDDGGTQPPDPNPPPASCPIGVAAFDRTLGNGNTGTVIDMAIDSQGNPVLATAELGTVGLSPANEVRFQLPEGSVVAVGPNDHTFVAGAFSEPTDFGTGIITPQGNVDTFLVELDAAGHVVSARSLNLCGDGVTSIAIDATGRIAVSGSALGTAVLSASGAIEFQLAYSGDVAFDAGGNLAVVGTFQTIDLGDGPIASTGNGLDFFVIEVDTGGARIWSHVLTGGSATGTPAVVTDAGGDVVFAGATSGTVDAFGTRITARFDPEAGRISGAFFAKIDAAGNPLLVHDAFLVEANGIAVAPNGHFIINGASTGNTNFGRLVATEAFDATGGFLGSREEFVASGDGRGLGIVVDACGNPYASYIASDSPSPFSQIRSYVFKLDPL